MGKAIHEKLVLGSLLLILAALPGSKYLLSVGMIGLLVLALIHPNRQKHWQGFLAYRPFVTVTGIFALFAISGLWSSDMDYFIGRLRIMLPFLILPFAVASIPDLSRKRLLALFYFFFGAISFSAVLVFIHYLLNYEVINDAIRQSRTMPTPCNHIRYSLMIAFSILIGIQLIRERFFLWRSWERWLIGLFTLFLLVFLHVLSVRSGLVAFYAALALWGVILILQKGKWWQVVLFASFMVALPFAAYQTIPGFKNKVDLTRWNYLMFKEGNIKNYSDTQRLYSYGVAFQLMEEHPVLGVGLGDVKQEVYDIYEEKYVQLHKMLPHNQYLYVLTATGILGFLIFLFLLLYPIFYRKNFTRPLFLAFNLIILMSFMVENTLGTSTGVGFYLIFLLLCLQYFRLEDQSVNSQT
ncbi:MAG: O-antigen ligase family protein [Bacteroidota bacterium]